MNIFKPPLPTYIPILENKEKQMDLWLESGTHYFHFKEGSKSYQGTLRVSYTGSKDAIAISADIYEVSYDIDSVQEYKLPSTKHYRSYWHSEEQPAPESEAAEFELHEYQYEYASRSFSEGRVLRLYIEELGGVTEGQLYSESVSIAIFKIKHLTDSFRQISVDVIMEIGSKVPDLIKDADTWKALEIDFKVNALSPPMAGKDEWLTEDLRKELKVIKNRYDNLDSEWRYFIFCVKQARVLIGEDAGFVFTKKQEQVGEVLCPAREGAVISSHWIFPDTGDDPNTDGRKISDKDKAYSRVFFHEIGHLLGLEHDEDDLSLMSTTSELRGVYEDEFLQKIPFSLSENHQKMLRHMSDAYVRPRMKDHGTYSSF